MKEPELEEEALTLRAESTALIVERRTIEDTALPVTLTYPDGDIADVTLTETEPGHFATRIDNAPRGLYRATSGDLFAIGAVGIEAAPEFENVVSTSIDLASLTEQTGGGIFEIRNGTNAVIPDLRRVNEKKNERSGDGWAGLVERNAERVVNVKDAPAIPALAWLIFIALSLLGAWAVEGGRLKLPQTSDRHS